MKTTSSPSQLKESATDSEKETTIRPNELERELFQKEAMSTPETTLPAPTVQIQVPQQNPTEETKPTKNVPIRRFFHKNSYTFNPPPLGAVTRFESEASRLTKSAKHIAYTSEIFNRTLQWADTSLAPGTIISKKSLTTWFPEWKSRLRVNCNDNRNFALCQVHAVVSWDSSSHTFRTYQIQPCPTLILFLSLDKDVKTSKDVDFTYCMVTSLLFIGSVMCRVDRLSYMPFLVERWKGYFSLAIIASEDELKTVDSFLKNYASLPNFRVTVYIVLSDAQRNYVVYTRDPNHKRMFNRRVFPINLLRDYALNNAETSHVMLLDMDLWPTR